MLSTIDFLKDVLPPLSGGSYVLTRKQIYSTRTQGKSSRWTNRSHTKFSDMSIEIAATNITALIDESSRTEYFFSLAEHMNNHSENKWGKKTVERTQKTATNFYCLAFDVDVGTNKPYKTQQSAIEAVHSAMTQIGFIDFGLVSSGNGVHVYILLEDEVSRDDWVEFSKRLGAALRTHNLEIDVSKCYDPSMVLRPVGSFNKKNTDEYKKVEVISWTKRRYQYTHVEGVLRNYTPIEVAQPAAKYDKSVDSAYKNEAKGNWQEAEQNCPQLQALAENANVPEPLWYAAIGVAAYCTEAETAAIRWSEKYEHYNKNTVIRKLTQWRKQATGPSLCANFGNLNPDGCSTCKYKGIAKTPLAAKESKVEVGITTPQGVKSIRIPYGYVCREEFGQYKIFKTGSEGEEVEVIEGIIYLDGYSMLQHERDPKTYLRWKFSLPRDESPCRVLEATAGTLNMLTGKESIIQRLMEAGLIIDSNKTKLVQQYLISMYKEHQRAHNATLIAEQMGWTATGSFVLAGEDFSKSGRTPVTATNKAYTDLIKDYSAKGGIEDWVKCTKMFVRDDLNLDYHAFCFLLAFGAPLMKFTGIAGALVSMYSDGSGTGKSTIGNLVTSVYANPVKAKFTSEDTDTSIFIKMGLLNNLPVYIDEVDWTPERTSEFLQFATIGKEKSRATKDLELRRVNEWSTIILCSTNYSFYDKLDQYSSSAQGQKNRLLEITIPRNAFFDKYGKVINTSLLQSNYGAVGREYIQHLVILNQGGNLEEKVLNCREEYESEMGFSFTGEERFIAATISCTWYGAKLAQQIGLISSEINLKRIFTKINFVVKAKRRMFIESKESAMDVVAEFVLKNNNRLVKVKNIDAPFASFGSCPSDEIVGRLEVWHKTKEDMVARQGCITVAYTAFRSFCQQTQRPFQMYLNELMESGLFIKEHRVVLASGVSETVNRTMAPKTSCRAISITLPPDMLAEYNIALINEDVPF